MSVYSNVPTLFKHSTLIALAEARLAVNPANPHINDIDLHHEKIDLYEFSRNARSEKTIKRMMTNPALVDINGLVINKYHRIESLLEEYKDQFDDLHWRIMSSSQNPAILRFVGKYPKNIHWISMSANKSPEAISILEEHLDKIDWWYLSANPSAIDILENNKDKIIWSALCLNPNAIHLIEQKMDKINWTNLCENPNAIHIIEQNLKKVTWSILSKNPNAIPILEQNLDKIYSVNFLSNPNAMQIISQFPEFEKLFQCSELLSFDMFLKLPTAIAYIENNADKITRANLHLLAENPNGLGLIQRLLDTNRITKDDVSFYATTRSLLSNESLYELDYQEMSKIRSRIIYKDLITETVKREFIKNQSRSNVIELGWFSANIIVPLCAKIKEWLKFFA